MSLTVNTRQQANWNKCIWCQEKINFKTPKDFCRHLRDFHCTREGGSYVCRYGRNGVCPSLPVDGVSDLDYEEHIMRDHVNQSAENTMSALQKLHTTPRRPQPPSEPSVVEDQHKWTVYKSKVNLPAALNDPRLLKRETDFFTKTWGVDFYDKTHLPVSPYLQEINWSHFDSYVKKTSAVKKNRTELEQIPKLFLMPTFNLENPSTFSAVFPWTQVEESKVDTPGARHSSKLLQEKMSHYLDIVEVQIAQQISRRDKMNSMDNLMARGSLKIMRLTKSRCNYIQLHNKLKLMATVHQTQPTIQTLLSTNEFVGALDLISTTQEVLSQELAGVHSLRHLGSQLAELQKLIDIMIQEDFHKHVTNELNRPVSDTSPIMDEMRLLNYRQWSALMENIFNNLLTILKRAKAFHGIVTDVVGIAAGRTKVPTPLQSPTTDSPEPLEEPTHLNVSVSGDVDVMVSSEEYGHAVAGLKELMIAVCDHAHDRCCKVLTARGKDGFLERLSSAEFVTLSRLIEKFVSDCEEVCGRKSTSLRVTVQSQ
ncbi:VPS54-like protein, partial [Mya arenaria]